MDAKCLRNLGIIMEKLEIILSKVFRLKPDQIHDSLTMQDVDRWDSLTHMDLVTSIEEGLGIELTMGDIMSMTDVKTIKFIVEQKLS